MPHTVPTNSSASVPGQDSASLGGNVATNAGGMQAVKHGVTRHHVLGLEVVLPTGEVMRTGGRTVKSSSGYDLTQLVIGSEGTLALRDRGHPQARPTIAMCGDGVGAVPHARRGVVGRSAGARLGARPADPRVHRPAHDGGYPPELRHRVGHPRRGAAVGTRLPVGAARIDQRRTPRRRRRQSRRAARRPRGDRRLRAAPGAAAQLVEARREGVLAGEGQWRERHRRRVRAARGDARLHGSGAGHRRAHRSWIAGCGHAGDGNVHLAVFQGDEAVRKTVVCATCCVPGSSWAG